ncbi:MAG: 50S ribosomal protein L35 [Planctomycetes bacterium GWF2_50_10]|nr:MAG: 50S ribosomal protein L35 [Planctomycetes bacterium GWF2_50_10]
MPKHKTHKGLKKRVKLTATGKIKRGKTGGSHLLSNKRSKWRRKMGTATTVKGSAFVETLTRALLG